MDQELYRLITNWKKENAGLRKGKNKKPKEAPIVYMEQLDKKDPVARMLGQTEPIIEFVKPVEYTEKVEISLPLKIYYGSCNMKRQEKKRFRRRRQNMLSRKDHKDG